MRKTPQQERSRRMVARIVGAARTLLAEQGYEAFSTNRVAAVAGVSPGSLYQYFPDKASLLDVVVDAYWDEVAERLVETMAAHAGGYGPQTIRVAVDALLGALESDPALLQVLTEQIPAGRLRERRHRLELRVRELATVTLTARMGLDPATAALRAWIIALAFENVAVRWVLDAPDFPRDRVVDEFAAMITG